MSEITLFPAWKQAEKDLIEQGIKPGQIITKEWLEEAFGLRSPATVEQYKKNELVFLRQFTDLRDSLLDNHRLMLRPMVGVGYQVILPEHQTATAMKDRSDEVKRAISKLVREVSHVQLDSLTDAQRKENADAIAKVGTLGALVRRQLKAPTE